MLVVSSWHFTCVHLSRLREEHRHCRMGWSHGMSAMLLSGGLPAGDITTFPVHLSEHVLTERHNQARRSVHRESRVILQADRASAPLAWVVDEIDHQKRIAYREGANSDILLELRDPPA